MILQVGAGASQLDFLILLLIELHCLFQGLPSWLNHRRLALIVVELHLTVPHHLILSDLILFCLNYVDLVLHVWRIGSQRQAALRIVAAYSRLLSMLKERGSPQERSQRLSLAVYVRLVLTRSERELFEYSVITKELRNRPTQLPQQSNCACKRYLIFFAEDFLLGFLCFQLLYDFVDWARLVFVIIIIAIEKQFLLPDH